MFNIVNGNAPDYMTFQVKMVRNQHNYSTRRSELSCVIPKVNSFGISSFLYTGISHWNNLPLSIKKCSTNRSFKREVKLYLFNKLEVQDQTMYEMY